jgi:uncharacterized protein YoxC
MSEAIIASIVSIVTFGIGYGKVIQLVRSNREISETKIANLQEQIDGLHKNNEDLTEILIDVKISIAEIKRDIHFIKDSLKK